MHFSQHARHADCASAGAAALSPPCFVLLAALLPPATTTNTPQENFDFFFEGDQEGDDRQHPPFVVDWRVMLGTVLAFLISCAVDVGGLAGGALLVPVFYQVVGFGLVSRSRSRHDRQSVCVDVVTCL